MKSKCRPRKRKTRQYYCNLSSVLLSLGIFCCCLTCALSWITVGTRTKGVRLLGIYSDNEGERSSRNYCFDSCTSLNVSSHQNVVDEVRFSRRAALSAIAIGGGSSIMAALFPPSLSFAVEETAATSNSSASYFEPVNLTKVVAENRINVTLVDTENKMCVVDDANLTKVTDSSRQQPWWLSWWKEEKKVQDIPKEQILVASILAGSFTEGIRTIVLHPLSTIKTRIQAKRPGIPASSNKILTDENLTSSFLNETSTPSLPTLSSFRKNARKGNLYAGIFPTLLVSVPCSGLYFGVRDVIIHDSNIFLDRTSSKLLAAFVADIVRLSIETPANLLTTRRQVMDLPEKSDQIQISLEQANEFNINSTTLTTESMDTSKYYSFENQETNEHQQLFKEVGENFTLLNNTTEEDERLNKLRNAISSQLLRDSWLRLPSLIITDLPYLLSRIALTSWFVQSGINLSEFEIASIFIACFCAALTTPFDVVQTRILLLSSSDNTSTNVTTELLSPYRVFDTMKLIMREKNGDNEEGGISNLFAGWLERTLYLGLGRAWLDPIRIIGYLGIRDAILLKWF